MSISDKVNEGLKTVLDAVKELPPEKVAMLGVTFMGLAAIFKKANSENITPTINEAKKHIEDN